MIAQKAEFQKQSLTWKKYGINEIFKMIKYNELEESILRQFQEMKKSMYDMSKNIQQKVEVIWKDQSETWN